MRPMTRHLTTCVAAMLLLSACAGTQSRQTDPVKDPWEGFNRKMHAFNMQADRYLVRPVAVAYDRVMPDPVQRGIGNFFRNLEYPVTFVNQLLQGKFREGGISTGRFLINSTVGVFGLFDVATRMGIEQYDEDFGQTFARWGYEESRYLVLPLLGPMTVRDALGAGADSQLDPVSYAWREEEMYWPTILDLVQSRAWFLAQDAAILDSYDPYIMVRDSWLQNREYKIYDGDPPLADYDAYLQDLEDPDGP